MVIGLGSGFCVYLFFLWVFVSLTSVFSLVFRECDDCVLHVLLICSADVFTGNACWYWRLDIGIN